MLCQDCRGTLEVSEYNYCLCSKTPLRLPANNKKGTCARCNDKKLSGLYFALPYQEKVLTKKLIYQFKYPPYIKTLSKTLAQILVEHLVVAKNNTQAIWQNSMLMPVPMEKSKMKSRGYNQTEELARELGQMINVPSVPDNIMKVKETIPQMELRAKDRQENMKNAFLVKRPSQIAGKKVFLVDDVYTTGSTMEECAKILKEAGAKSVWGIAVAREG